VPDELTPLLDVARAAAPSSTPASGSNDVAVGLVLARNKVTHIYELVKAIGGARQVEYDRTARTWGRRDSIAAKHEHESAVDPFIGHLATGVAHAPLLYASDPRSDLPTELATKVESVIGDLDPMIIGGWLEAADR
jgi:hypothetical protein